MSGSIQGSSTQQIVNPVAPLSGNTEVISSCFPQSIERWGGRWLFSNARLQWIAENCVWVVHLDFLEGIATQTTGRVKNKS
jgi:hypothetical protein